MAISAQILEAQNEFENRLYISVASLSFFRECWLPGIKALGLTWTRLFIPGVDITVNELPVILNELKQLKEWASLNLHDVNHDHFIERVNSLIEELPSAFQRDDAVVFIG
ncbi:hypothetical protein [Paenibacillus ihuae]|uniref:hypothetical protein n=1 Tax=Paenibacillus ihuae TaxID=1232431 RepID=UPI0006D573B5|nr:hypothetical protein [Paenibacillus ihuae]